MFLTHGGRDLYFCSDRPDPKGPAAGERTTASAAPQSDIWVVSRTESEGPAINTAESEYKSMLSPDGKYLFFTRGRLGYDDLYWVEAEVLR